LLEPSTGWPVINPCRLLHGTYSKPKDGLSSPALGSFSYLPLSFLTTTSAPPTEAALLRFHLLGAQTTSARQWVIAHSDSVLLDDLYRSPRRQGAYDNHRASEGGNIAL
jgi:hypothetical protein